MLNRNRNRYVHVMSFIVLKSTNKMKDILFRKDHFVFVTDYLRVLS